MARDKGIDFPFRLYDRMASRSMVAVVPYFCTHFLLSIFAMYTNNIIMTPDTKEKIQYSTAVAMIASAVVLAFICFFLNHYKIEDSVLWYIAQALVYAASIFGISLAIKTKMGEVKNDVKQYVDDELNKHKNAKN